MIERWDVITIGNLSRNRYWGESDDRRLRDAWCTCTLVRGADFKLLVDPSLKDPAAMAAELDRRTGLKPEAVEAVFMTHSHGDHHWGIEAFPTAHWWAAEAVARKINEENSYSKEVQAAPEELYLSVELVHTPGHTLEHHSLRFECDGKRVLIAGDAVMTRDFYAHRQGYFNSVDFELAARTIEKIGGMADIVVPGHDNWFLTEVAGFV